MNTYANPEFATRYPAAEEDYRNAIKLLSMGMAKDSLGSARRALEGIVKNLCKKGGMETSDNSREIKLIDMIDALKEHNIVSEQEASELHKTRILCNKGAHPGDAPPDLDDAETGIEMLSKVLVFLMEKDALISAKDGGATNIPPMVNSKYYDPQRRYCGQWSNCTSYENLESISEYSALKKSADKGDVSSMLDLAVGFLDKNVGTNAKRVWSRTQLVCMPMCRKNGKEYFNNRAYDARYYYWILRACDQAVANLDQGKSYSQKYIATAFLEAIKFVICISTEDPQSYVKDVWVDQHSSKNNRVVYANQYALVKELYGRDLTDSEWHTNAIRWARELLRLVKEYGPDIITLHKETTEQSIKYLAYCLCFLQSNDDSAVLDEELALSPEDIGSNITPYLLEQRIPADMSDAQYYWRIVDDWRLRKEWEEREEDEIEDEDLSEEETDETLGFLRDYTDEECLEMSEVELYMAAEENAPHAMYWYAHQIKDSNMNQAYSVYYQLVKLLQDPNNMIRVECARDLMLRAKMEMGHIQCKRGRYYDAIAWYKDVINTLEPNERIEGYHPTNALLATYEEHGGHHHRDEIEEILQKFENGSYDDRFFAAEWYFSFGWEKISYAAYERLLLPENPPEIRIKAMKKLCMLTEWVHENRGRNYRGCATATDYYFDQEDHAIASVIRAEQSVEHYFDKEQYSIAKKHYKHAMEREPALREFCEGRLKELAERMRKRRKEIIPTAISIVITALILLVCVLLDLKMDF